MIIAWFNAKSNKKEFFVLSFYVSTFWVSCGDVGDDSRINSIFVSSFLELFIGGLMFYLRYLCLFAYSGVQQTVNRRTDSTMEKDKGTNIDKSHIKHPLN